MCTKMTRLKCLVTLLFLLIVNSAASQPDETNGT